MDTIFKEEIGKRIKNARIKAHLTQSELAEKADVSTNHVSAVERGIYDTRVENFAKIVNALGISADEILFEEKVNPANDLMRAIRIASAVCEEDKLAKYILAGIELLRDDKTM